MFLIFHLGRPDVVSTGDLGIRRAVQIAYGLDELPGPTGAGADRRAVAPPPDARLPLSVALARQRARLREPRAPRVVAPPFPDSLNVPDERVRRCELQAIRGPGLDGAGGNLRGAERPGDEPLRRAASGRRGRSPRPSGAGRRDRPWLCRGAGRGHGARSRSGSTSPTGMVALARRNHPELEFTVGDAEDLPLQDGSFDAVVGNFVINHLPEPERAARGGRSGPGRGRPPRLLGVAAARPDADHGADRRGDRGRATSRRTSEPPGSLPGRTATGSPTRPSSGACSRAPGLAEVAVEPVELVQRIADAEAALARLHGRERARLDVRSGSVRRRAGADPGRPSTRSSSPIRPAMRSRSRWPRTSPPGRKP